MEFLTALHVANRFFTVPIQGERTAPTELARASRAANRSLGRLKDRGWVDLVPIFTFPDRHRLKIIEINALTVSGIETVAQLYDRRPETAGMVPTSTGKCDVAPEIIAHELVVRDALVSLLRICEAHQVPVHWWTMDARALLAAGGTLLQQAPDVIMLVGEERVPLFVEVDLGTESIDSRAPNSWRTKHAKYTHYLEDDAGRDPLFDGCSTPRVVVLGQSDLRLANLQHALQTWGVDRRWWLATLEEIAPAVFFRSPVVWTLAVNGERGSLAATLTDVDRR